ncbi:MAG: thiol:disulfide interchange protein DsbC [Paraglaciecola sp.]|jgi:thiol:disulfide interchange protein DsbC|uniref:bifunctional protein-disulfide isomerase/oxidoreductase DsbC n=1 Tax=uncultured Paraglaciecola sp. TaxID=1765024 RepID=UPI0025D16A53|nr:bifunctional protein-disulfide isomerase/oxidoreductase DsbC [uncultured Paraglaciecola sp.]
MKNWTKIGLALSGLVSAVSLNTFAADDAPNYGQVKAKLQASLGMQVSSIGDAPVSGLLQVMTEKGLFYTSEDGKYLLQARIYNIEDGMRNVTEEALGSVRLGGLKEFKDAFIEYKADKEKYVVNIFTDITCGYCRKLHNEMDQYNALGITVRYLAFPRGGINSNSFTDMVSVWCADDKQEAMNNAKAGGTVANKNCETKVAEQYAFGQRIGVNGTPNIIMPNGSVIPGYQPPKQLEEALKAIL